MKMMMMMTITSAVVTFFTLAILIPVSGVPVCVKPDPLVRRITEKDGAGTNIFISRGVVNASYTFQFEAQSNYSETYFDKFFEYRHTGDTWVLQLTRALDLDLIARGSSQGLLLSAKIFCTIDKEDRGEMVVTDVNVTDMDMSPVVESRTVPSVRKPKESYIRLVHVRNVDEFDPSFSSQRVITVREDADLDHVVVRLGYLFSDKDFSGQASIVQYFSSIKYEGNLTDGQDVFEVKREGDTVLKRPLDFEKGDKVFGLGVVGHDFGGRSAKTAVEIHVINLNDNPPVFVNTGCLAKCNLTHYYAIISSNYVGTLTAFSFGPVHADDADGDAIEYSLLPGILADYKDYVTIDKDTGVLNISKPLKPLGTIAYVDIRIQAMSASNLTKPREHTLPDVAETFVHLWLTQEAVVAHSTSAGRSDQARLCAPVLALMVLVYFGR